MKTLLSYFVPVLLLLACSSSGSSSSGGTSSGGVVPPVSGPLTASDAAKAAVLLGSCIPDDRSNRFLEDIYNQHESDPRFDLARNSVACLAGRTDGCKAVTDCTGVTVSTDAACKDGCAGDVLTACDDSLKFTEDCSRVGAKCFIDGKGRGTCDFAAPVACSGTASTCVDGRTSFCDGTSLSAGPKCADYFGSTCVQGDEISGCKGPGGACESSSFSGLNIKYSGQSCAGTTLKACMNGGLIDVDCSKIGVGFTCQSSGTTSFCGTAADCVPAKDKATCDGTSLVICNAGHTEKVDCTGLGFTGCSAAAGACTPSPFGN